MRKSYFAKYQLADGVSIARWSPIWYSGRNYPDLFPSYGLLVGYKNGEISEEEYTERYYKETLSKLDPQKVYDDLKDKVILCYEKPTDFCHRHLVAKWMKEELGIEVEEVTNFLTATDSDGPSLQNITNVTLHI